MLLFIFVSIFFFYFKSINSVSSSKVKLCVPRSPCFTVCIFFYLFPCINVYTFTFPTEGHFPLCLTVFMRAKRHISLVYHSAFFCMSQVKVTQFSRLGFLTGVLLRIMGPGAYPLVSREEEEQLTPFSQSSVQLTSYLQHQIPKT